MQVFLNLSSSAATVCISFFQFPDCVILQILFHSIIESQSAFSIFIILTDGKVDDIGASNEQVCDFYKLLLIPIDNK